MKLSIKKLLVPVFVALTLVVSVGATGSVSAKPDSPKPKVESQCDQKGPGYFGFSSKEACKKYAKEHGNKQDGHGYGYGGDKDKDKKSTNIVGDIVLTIQHIADSTVNVFLNIFSKQ